MEKFYKYVIILYMDLKSQIGRQNFTFKKSLGQNFISDTNLLLAIASDAQITKEDTVVEIGAGAGTLTKVLCGRAKRVFTYEIDSSLKNILEENLGGVDNVTLYFADFLKVNIEDLEKEIQTPYKVVANIPYYISTPLISNLMEKTTNCLSITVTVQKEVADRIIAVKGKQYGALSLCVQSRAAVTVKRKLVKECFYPQPDIDSALIHISFKEEKLQDGEFFRSVVKAAFSSRRKTLQNNLTAHFKLSRQQINLILEELNLNLNCRAEELNIEQFIILAKKIKFFQIPL